MLGWDEKQVKPCRQICHQCFLLTALLTTLSETDNYNFRRTSVPRVAIHTSQAHLVRKYQIVMREKGWGGFCPVTFQIFFLPLGFIFLLYTTDTSPQKRQRHGETQFWFLDFCFSISPADKAIRKKQVHVRKQAYNIKNKLNIKDSAHVSHQNP